MLRRIIIYTLAAGLLSAPAIAINPNYDSSDGWPYHSDQLNINAGIKLTFPLNSPSYKTSPKARLGLNISLRHHESKRWNSGIKMRSIDILEWGVFENGDPNFSLLGQNIVEPKFDPLYANSDNENDKKPSEEDSKSRTRLYIAGGAVFLAISAVLINEAAGVSISCEINENRNAVTC